jgi:guanosine-diphosphatase
MTTPNTTAPQTDKNSPSAHSSGLQVPSESTQSSSTSTLRSRYLSMISPRSSNYERLEGGMGPGRLSNWNVRRFGWKKFGIVACVFIGLVYLFGPRQNRWRSQHGSYLPFFRLAEEKDLK